MSPTPASPTTIPTSRRTSGKPGRVRRRQGDERRRRRRKRQDRRLPRLGLHRERQRPDGLRQPRHARRRHDRRGRQQRAGRPGRELERAHRAALRVCSPNPFVSCNERDCSGCVRLCRAEGHEGRERQLRHSRSSKSSPTRSPTPRTRCSSSPRATAARQVGDNNDTAPSYPCQYPSPNVICVAATDQNDNRAVFSNYGDVGVDLAAPGANIVSTYPNSVRFADDFQARRLRHEVDHWRHEQHVGAGECVPAAQLLHDGQPCRATT